MQNTIIQQQVRAAIVNYLEASEPGTLEEILADVKVQCEISTQRLLPTVIVALSEMAEAGLIAEYDQMPIDDPLEYAWVLSPSS